METLNGTNSFLNGNYYQKIQFHHMLLKELMDDYKYCNTVMYYHFLHYQLLENQVVHVKVLLFHKNVFYIKYNKISWLDFRFQVMWLLEIAWKYPFLYKLRKKKNDIITDCIEASLSTSFFLHFAGSWYESNMWLNKRIYNTKNKIVSI